MGQWTTPEIEMFISLSSSHPTKAGIFTNWTYYLTRFERCEAFVLEHEWVGDQGGRQITGSISLADFNYLYLRKNFGSDNAEQRFWAERKQLATEPEVYDVDFQPTSGERETVIHARADERYWLAIETDMAHWLRRLDAHPFAVCVRQQRYPDGDSECRLYMIPRSLLTIRRARPQYSEEYKAQLRARLAQSRPKRD